jgi:hypothetical protein
MKMKGLYLNAVYTNIYNRPAGGSQLQPKNATRDKSIKASVVCDLFDAYTCDSSVCGS